MALSKDKVSLTVAIDKDVKELLEKYAKDLDLTLSKIVRNLILISLEDFNIIEKVGLFKACNTLRKFLMSISSSNGKVLIDGNTEDNVNISVIMDQSTKDLVDSYSQKLDLPVKRFVRNLIYTALDDYKYLKKTGLIRIAFHFKNLIQSQKEFEESVANNN